MADLNTSLINFFVQLVNAGITFSSGAGSPESVVTANIGSLYLNTSGGANTTLYVKTATNGANTGWTAK